MHITLKALLLLLPSLIYSEIGYVEPWGKDEKIELKQQPLSSPPSHLSWIGHAAEKIILFHQHTLSPTTGPRSHFRPSSSHYALQAIRERGFIRGFFMGCDRLMRENSDPWVYKTKKLEGILYKWDPPDSSS